MPDSGAPAHTRQIQGWLPGLDVLRYYQRPWLRGDLVAAFTLWALVVPQAIAYAQIAGLPPQAGLYATFAGLLAYSLLGSSRQLVVSPTSSTAAISAALIAPMAAGSADEFAALAAALAMIVGVALIGLGLLHMGFVSRFIAAGVQVGFMFGLGLTIIVGQVPKLLGVSGSEGTFFEQLAALLGNLDGANAWTAALGFSALAALLGLRRISPALPGALAVVIAGIALVAIFDLTAEGVEVIGAVDSGVPIPAWPDVGWSAFEVLLPGALAIAIIGYAESATVAESLAEEHDYEVRSDRELTAVGGANVLSGLFQGFITGGGASQSAANDRAGAQTQLAGLIVSGLTALTAIALVPLFRDLPQAVLGAIVISAVLGFLNLPALRRLARLRRESLIIALVTMGAVLVLGILSGLIVAVALSVLFLLERVSRPHGAALGRLPLHDDYVELHREALSSPVPGVLVYRLNAPLLFVNAKAVRDEVTALLPDQDEPVRIVLLDLSFSPDLDVEGINVIESLQRKLAVDGAGLWLACVHGDVQAVLERSGLLQAIGEEHVFRRLEDAPVDDAVAQPARAT